MSSVNPYDNSENSLVEIPTIELFKKLGWETYNAFNEFEYVKSPLERDNKSEIILITRLRKSLEKINPSIIVLVGNTDSSTSRHLLGKIELLRLNTCYVSRS